MPTYFCLTVRFLQPFAHGRVDGGEPEWPPSPMRAFQALVAASAGRWNERTLLEYATPALRWLELVPQPTIVAAVGAASKVKCQFFVPDNTADLVVPAWSRGELNKVVKRTEKIVRPTHLHGDAVHYLFSLPNGTCPHFDVLQAAARSITHLGWGVDMVAGNAELFTEEGPTEQKLARQRLAATEIAVGLDPHIAGQLPAPFGHPLLDRPEELRIVLSHELI